MNKVYSFLCLIARARKLISGGEQVERSLKKRKLFIVIIAMDSSDNIKKRMSDKCKYYNIDLKVFGTKELIGKFIGKEERAVIGITDFNFAKKMCELIEEYNNLNGGEAIGKSPSL
jgi:ribosomal protein L7Ae-like RNA K-turn-binding protein